MSGGKKQQDNRRDSVKNRRFHLLPPEHSRWQFTAPSPPRAAALPSVMLNPSNTHQFKGLPHPAVLRNSPPPRFHSDTFQRWAAAGPFPTLAATLGRDDTASGQIGRASCRERV